ncbi:MAG: DUF262 domain-containing protein [Ardenticatenaceae bacterium]|nr:DUF262 domain-containing protein [Ardenticatenaceae bacterium]
MQETQALDSKSIDITGREKTVRQLLDNVKYTIDYYQREYKWQAKNITELLSDLEDKFDDFYSPEHSRKMVRNYGAYFLGSIVISRKNGQNFIIDGQQRLTSLTLLLIYIHNLQKESDSSEVNIASLIFSDSYGELSFNLDIPERTACMKALYETGSYDVSEEKKESVRTIVARYENIVENFPEGLKGEALPYFIDWLRERVYLVEITAYSDEDAYIIFETMNDRGLSLSPTDMLKGYLLSNITDDDDRDRAHTVWRQNILDLLSVGKEEEIDFFKAWLRAKYATNIRDRRKGAKNQDWERIGTTFHKWVREEAEAIKLKSSDAFTQFITKELAFYGRHYIRLRKAAETFTPGLEPVFYNANVNFTLQYPLLLAPLNADDDLDTVDRKIRLVATFIDIFIARRIWNFRTLGYSAIVYTMFNLMKDVRGKSVSELVSLLHTRVAEMDYDFDSEDFLRVHQQNRRQIHYLLARLTHHIEQQCGVESTFPSYISRSIKKPYEVEHIWGDHFAEHADEFENDYEFQRVRNRIGGLILLPRGFNQSLGVKPFEHKVHHYFGQNLLAQTLSAKCYENNPSFRQFVGRSGLPFRPYEHFKEQDLMERQELYRQISKQLWHPSRFDQELSGA